jgi:hypothetical protein
MTRYFVILGLILFSISTLVADTLTNDQSTGIFNDILRRIPRRDPESHAILKVRPRQGPGVPQDLWANFGIQELASSNEVRITLWNEQKDSHVIWETYTLPIDDAIRKELDNQRRHKTIVAEREKRQAESSAKKIGELTGGKLKYGMTLQEVKAVMGEPTGPVHSAQLIGHFGVDYPDLSLTFQGFRLRDAAPRKEK